MTAMGRLPPVRLRPIAVIYLRGTKKREGLTLMQVNRRNSCSWRRLIVHAEDSGRITDGSPVAALGHGDFARTCRARARGRRLPSP